MKMMFEIVDSIGDKFVKAIDKELKISENLEMREILAKYSTVNIFYEFKLLNVFIFQISMI